MSYTQHDIRYTKDQLSKMCKTEGSSNGVSLIEIFCQNSSEAHRTGAVVAQMPVDQIWRRGIAVAVVAATAECECPALPAPSDRHRLAYVCHVSIVMHGGAVAAAAGREGKGRSDGPTAGRPIIMPNSGLYPIRALHRTAERELEECALV